MVVVVARDVMSALAPDAAAPRVARALLPSLQADHRIPLHQALSARKHVDPVTNVSFLKQFARKVSGKMSRMSPSTAGSSKFSLRRKTQRWALRHAPLAALAQIARRGTPVAETGASDEAQERSIL